MQFTDRHVGVLIGRFQPAHKGHMYLIENALKEGITKFKIFIGSANSSQNMKNPFSFQVRKDMVCLAIQDLLKDRGYFEFTVQERIISGTNETIGMYSFQTHRTTNLTFPTTIQVEIYPLNDYLYNDSRWAIEFTSKLFSNDTSFNYIKQKHVLLGFNKDETSFYLDMFHDLEQFFPKEPFKINDKMISATDIRKCFFGLKDYPSDGGLYYDISCRDYLSNSTSVYLDEFYLSNREQWRRLHEEYKFIEEYKKSWSKVPYPPTFVTTDALIVQDNHVLLIKRKTQPGKDMWAMPGGFLKERESLSTGMIRELIEETGLKVPAKILTANIKKVEVIDNPFRSERGRTITHCFHIALNSYGTALPHIRGNSDAKQAKWFPLHEVIKMKPRMFEDHWDIMSMILGF